MECGKKCQAMTVARWCTVGNRCQVGGRIAFATFLDIGCRVDGMLLPRGADCGHDKRVAFSCKCRAFRGGGLVRQRLP